MKVSKLIEELETHDPNLEVWIVANNGADTIEQVRKAKLQDYAVTRDVVVIANITHTAAAQTKC